MADSRNLPPSEDMSAVAQNQGMTSDERDEIEREIDALVAQSGRETKLPQEYLQPRRSGVGLPFLIWILAGAAFAAGFYFITSYFQVREEAITLESRAYFSAEAQLIEEILRESEQRLAEKEREIDEIEDRLARLNAERQSLQENLEERVAEREAELRAELQTELQAERERLAEAGRSEAEIDAQLNRLESELQAEVNDELEAFREEAQEQVAELRAQLGAQEAQLEQTLQASREERARLAEEAAQREAELRQQYGERIAALEESERAALEQIEELQQLRDQEQLLADRVLGSFTVIVQDIEEGLTEEALAGLESLERLLLDEEVGTAGRRRRRETELALVATLRSLVQEVDVLRQNLAVRDLTATDVETAQLEQERAAQLIETARNTVALAEEAREAGRFSEARSLYQQALATIPSLEQVYPGILELESTRRRIALENTIAEAQTLLEQGNAQAAVERYLDSLETIAADEDDPLLDVAAGIDVAVTRTADDRRAAQDALDAEYREQLSERAQQITRLNRSLSAARNSLATADATAESLRSQLADLQAELETEQARTTEQAATLATLRRRIATLESDVATAETDLAAARRRSESLQQSLSGARSQARELEAENTRLEQQLAEATSARAELEAQVASLREQLAERPEAPPEDAPEEPQVPAATQEELQELRRTIAAREQTIRELEARLGDTQSELSEREETVDSLRADLEEANAQIAGLQERVGELQESRAESTDEAQELEQEVESLRGRIAELESLEEDVDALTRRYEDALQTAQRDIRGGRYEQARRAVLSSFGGEHGRDLFPGFVSTLNTTHDRLVEEAEALTAEDMREETLEQVVGLATEVQQNIDEPQEAISVQTYLRRRPALREVANELFEIVELSRRAISAPEIEYRLLGSVSRVTGNLVVVERLVALQPEVADTIEIRRAPTLGQEIPIASGTILEVTDRRVVVSIDEIYELDQPPATRDLAYIAVE